MISQSQAQWWNERWMFTATLGREPIMPRLKEISWNRAFGGFCAITVFSVFREATRIL